MYLKTCWKWYDGFLRYATFKLAMKWLCVSLKAILKKKKWKQYELFYNKLYIREKMDTRVKHGLEIRHT